MHNPPIRSPWARLAFGVLCLFWLGAGWLVLLEGGFYKTVKYSTETTFVGGWGGWFMAGLFLVLSAIAGLVALREFTQQRIWHVALFAAILGPAGLFALTR